jgi:hypothetical protein
MRKIHLFWSEFVWYLSTSAIELFKQFTISQQYEVLPWKCVDRTEKNKNQLILRFCIKLHKQFQVVQPYAYSTLNTNARCQQPSF